MEKEKISIIVPVYNIAPYLVRCLDSLCAQTYENLEILAVDDGSTDESGRLLEEYAQKDRRLRVIRKENGGVTSARLRGAAEATGDWIAFADGDDYVEPDMYRRLLDNAEKYHADISHCGFRMVFPDWTEFYYNTGKTVCRDNAGAVRDLVSMSYLDPALWNKVFRRSLFDAASLCERMDRSVRINEDLLMNYYLFRQSACSVYEDFCPYHYILRKNSAATSDVKDYKLTDPIRVMERILDDITDPETRACAQHRYLKCLVTAAINDAFPDIAADAKKKGRRVLKENLKEKAIPTKMKGQAALAFYAPALYRFVRRIGKKGSRYKV